MSTVKIGDHASLKYTPKFWNPEKAYQNYKPDIEGAYNEGVEYAQKHNLEPAQSLIARGEGDAIWETDLQDDFRDFGRLPVKGTDDVVLRTVVMIINGTTHGSLAGYVKSRDGHPILHRSYASSYRGKDGRPLDMRQQGNAGCLTLVDEKKAIFKAYGFNASGLYDIGYYQPLYNAVPPKDPKMPDRSAVSYWKHLQKTGQGDIWVFNVHCLLNSDGANTHPFLQEAIAFMCGARAIQPTIIGKGHIDSTDWFGAFEPCWPDPSHPQGGLQKPLLDSFKPFRMIFSVGVAGDFCVYYGQLQIMNYFEGTEYFSKFVFITDGTAYIVPNAPQVQKLHERARQGGIKFITHDAALAA